MQHSAKHTLPTGSHKMVMKMPLSADNEIEAASTDTLAAGWDWTLILLFKKCCIAGKEKHLQIGECIYDGVTCLPSLKCLRWEKHSHRTKHFLSLSQSAEDCQIINLHAVLPLSLLLRLYSPWQHQNHSSKLIYQPCLFGNGALKTKLAEQMLCWL